MKIAQELSPILNSLFCQGTSRGAVRPGDLREGEVGGEDGALLQIPHQLRCVVRAFSPRSDRQIIQPQITIYISIPVLLR